MNKIAIPDPADLDASGTNRVALFSADGFDRCLHDLDERCSVRIDVHRHHGARFLYLCIAPSPAEVTIDFSALGRIEQVSQVHAFGTVLRCVNDNGASAVWMPHEACAIRSDVQQRIQPVEDDTISLTWGIYPDWCLTIHRFQAEGARLVVPYVVVDDASGEIFQSLQTVGEIEQRLFRKSNWFFAGSPSAIWNALIDGSIYDPRTSDRIGKRFKCQQCAFSWWNYFQLLGDETGKRIYAIVQDEVAFSVLLDLSAGGRWGHGYLSDEMETHARFHLDGIHLLISQYEKTGDSPWLEATQSAMAFIFEHLTDAFDESHTWYLHDTMEFNRRHRFKIALFGKKPGNSLCINTHVQAMTVLNRLRAHFPDDHTYTRAYENACNALRQVLDHRPAELVYRLIGPWIIKNRSKPNRTSTAARLADRIGNRLLNKVYWPFQRRFPRMVYPNGFIERDLSRSMASDRYMVTNVKDLLTLCKQDPMPWLRSYCRKGTAFLRRFIDASGLPFYLQRSPYYIEFVDILLLCNALVEPIAEETIQAAEMTIYAETGGYSLDFCSSPLVRGTGTRIETPVKAA